jgi:hypothetical protein
MPRHRFQSPDRLLGAANFSDEDQLRGSLNTVKLIKSQPWVWDQLREACELEVKYARKREPGHWELAAIAFVASRLVDIQPWWDESAEELWIECGFEGKPPYLRVWRRLRELEKVCEKFLEAAALVIQRCKKHDARVMSPEEREAKNTPEKVQIVQRGGQTIKRVRVNGCWYRTLDLEAGIRAYAGKFGLRRFWTGYYGGKAIDHFTGGVIPSVDSASTNECHLFPQLFDRVKAMAGEAPETAIADRGMSIASCFEHATRNGTAPVFPWRKWGDGIRHDFPTFDRHGVKRCKHCGGETEQIRFSAANNHPRLWFRCMNPTEPGCEKEQTIACKTDWRSLIPLARTEGLYHELKKSHQSFEHAHDLWRDRYRVSADTLGIRPKAVGFDWHRLRANVACLIDWLRIAAKNGWLGLKSSGKVLVGKRKFKSRGEKAAEELADERARIGLGRPYGAAAAAIGMGPKEPPSRRQRKPPPRPALASP